MSKLEEDKLISNNILALKQKIKDALSINDNCRNDLEFSDNLKPGDSCHDCEHMIAFGVGIIGGMVGANAGSACMCEKGYWKEEV